MAPEHKVRNHEVAPGFRQLPKSHLIESTIPIVDGDKTIFYKAPAVKWKYSRILEGRKNGERLGVKNPGNFQIVMVAPPQRGYDFSVDLYNNLIDQPLGAFPVAEYRESTFGKDRETKVEVIDENVPETVYIVASPLDAKDYALVNEVASKYRKNPKVKRVVLVAPFMGNQREDKNAKQDPDTGAISYTGQTIKIASIMEMLRSNFDKIINFEPHSSASQAWAMENGISFAPVSLWRMMTDRFIARLEAEEATFRADEYAFIRPDKGRNIAALRIQDYLGIKNKVNFEKDRDGQGNTTFRSLTQEQVSEIRGKNLLLYDDEGATFGTMYGVIEKLVDANAGVKSINVLLGHARFADSFYDSKGKYHPGWRENIDLIMAKAREAGIKVRFMVSDSRQALGDVYSYSRNNPGLIEFVSVVPLIRQAIETDVNGINFWRDKMGFRELLIQSFPRNENEE